MAYEGQDIHGLTFLIYGGANLFVFIINNFPWQWVDANMFASLGYDSELPILEQSMGGCYSPSHKKL